MKNLKKAEIKNGKICLEGKVIDAKFLTLTVERRADLPNAPRKANAYVMGKGYPYPVLYLNIKAD
ncbi:unnamed protein product, partial [marine sediment metagenome]